MFLNLECPAMFSLRGVKEKRRRRFYPSGRRFGTPAMRAG
jgi:hypothetical protein